MGSEVNIATVDVYENMEIEFSFITANPITKTAELRIIYPNVAGVAFDAKINNFLRCYDLTCDDSEFALTHDEPLREVKIKKMF